MQTIPVLISADRISARVREMGARIAADAAGKPVHLVGVLKGCFVFLADLAREIPGDVSVDFIRVGSYRGTESTGEVRLEQDLKDPIEGRHVVLVEDIVDTGATVDVLRRLLLARKPASLRVCALLHKPARSQVDVTIDYLGFTIPDRFVIGYGLDFDGLYRNLPFVGVLENGAP